MAEASSNRERTSREDRAMNGHIRRLFITGNSSGLGLGLTEAYLNRGWEVYGLSRRGCPVRNAGLHDVRCDLADFSAIPAALDALLGEVADLNLVILNAGLLGRINEISATPIGEILELMDVNVWANKLILDWLTASSKRVDEILLISSGAAVLGNKGWGGYALSKATLNMLARLYAHELPATHLAAVAPGLIDTSMMDYLCEVPDPEQFPAVVRLREAKGTERMPEPRDAAERLIAALPGIRGEPSGSFVDIRKINARDEYAQLMQTRSEKT